MPSFSRVIFLLHRYFGIGLGLVVTLWCLSGFVMMYVPYPEVSGEDNLKASPYLNLSGCCQVPGLDEFSDIRLNGARIVTWPSGPMLFLQGGNGGEYAIDLQTSEYVFEVTAEMAEANALQYSREYGLSEEVDFLDVMDLDQWTVYNSYNSLRYFYRYQPRDGKGTILYVSAVTGEVVQHTDRAERAWNWVGAVVHWIYPTVLRQNQQAWFWTVVILSGLSLFLTITGIYIAIRYLQFGKNGKLSPYKGWGMWHHYLGLAFGIATLTWLLSGLLSMTPFSSLEGRSLASEASIAQGGAFTFDAEIRESIRALADSSIPADSIAVEYGFVDGRITAEVLSKTGERQRYNSATWLPENLPLEHFSNLGQKIRPETKISSQGWIEQEDSYYYARRTDPYLPAYRVIYEDGERAYFDGVSGALVRYVDAPRQWNRWLYNGLHSLDFNNFIRQRPVWDILVLLLLVGVTAGSITGTWIGIRRLLPRGSK